MKIVVSPKLFLCKLESIWFNQILYGHINNTDLSLVF